MDQLVIIAGGGWLQPCGRQLRQDRVRIDWPRKFVQYLVTLPLGDGGSRLSDILACEQDKNDVM